MDPILDDLNPAQRDAVLHGTGPVMVLAGAGSGKTRVITRRIAKLLCDGVGPSEVLALTFTNKAAGEMQRRVEELGGGRVHVSTFHSACARFLRRDAERIGFPRDFSIYDTYDRDSCVKMLMRDRNLDAAAVKPAHVGRRISQLKNLGVTADELVVGFDPVDRVVEAIFRPYRELLLRLGAMDFDDLLGRFLDLLKDNPDVAERYQERFRWLLVDEFQDTNRIQYELTKKLCDGHRNLCVVGDPDQSIYRFRGADIRNILDFERDFPETVTIRLETNYRSTKCILRAAEGVISNNLARKEKALVTDNAEGAQLELQRCAGPAQEAREIATRTDGLIRAGVGPGEIAVFYRSHFLSRALEEAMRNCGVPYDVIGGVSFFERREIKDLLAYLRVIVNPLDDVSMERVINVPPRGIGKVTLDKLRRIGAAQQMSLFEVVCEPTVRDGLGQRAERSLRELAAVYDEVRPLAPLGAHTALRAVTEATDYLGYVGGIGDPEDSARMENVAELHNDAMVFDTEVGGGLCGYLQHVSLLTAEDRRRDVDERVSLMTVHAAKGLEFDHVFLAGLEQGLFPHSRSFEEEAGFEEERRLMYVALTRARERVWIGHCDSRMVNGMLQRQKRSCFIDEIPSDCLEERDDALFGGEDWGGRGGRRSRAEGTFYAAGGGTGFDGDSEIDYSQEIDLDVDLHLDPDDEFATGSRVIHPVYGCGTVLRMSGVGSLAKVTVRFDKAGERVLILEYAGLQVLPAEGDR